MIGMLHYRKYPTDVKKAYPFAAVAKMEGIDFFYFSFGEVDFDNMKINGWVYEKGEWIQKRLSFPAVVINSCSPRSKKQTAILKRLRTQTLFTSYPVGNKLKVYKKILNGKQFSNYLIPSIKLASPQELLHFFHDQSKAVLKPLSGNHGKGVVFIEHLEGLFKITDGAETRTTTEKGIEGLVEPLIRKEGYLLQPFIECKTKAGLTYDFRLHVQKNGFGNWEVNLIYPRISGNSKMVSNISSGGYRGELEPFLKEEFGTRAINIKEHLEHFACSFAAHFDTLYEHSFDELGIDVGMDDQENVWIFEVNWRPGSKNREFEVARRLIPYCKYLASQ